MANTIKQKRGTSDPGASDLVVGELAINTTDGGVFTKTDGGSVVEVGAGGGGGSWNLISTTTVSSAVASVDFTSIGSYNRYVLLWDGEMDGAQVSKIQIYDNGSLVTSSDYVMLRSRMSSGGSAFATTFSGWIVTNGMVSQIGRFEISVAAPRATIEMMQGGLLGTADTCNTMFVHGGMKSTYSITDITGFRFTTTSGTAEIESGRFSLYGIGQ